MATPIGWLRELVMSFFPTAFVFVLSAVVIMVTLSYATHWFWKEWSGFGRCIVWILLVVASVVPSMSGAWIVYNIDFPFPPTEYAPDYTLQGFRRVEVGLNREDVYGLIGKPLHSEHIGESEFEHLWYSRHRFQSEPGMIIRDGFWYRVVTIHLETNTVDAVVESYYSSF